MHKIVRLTYNWRVVSDGCQTIDVCEEYNLGVGGVTEIKEHRAAGEGDKWFYEVHFENGQYEMIFNPNIVVWQ